MILEHDDPAAAALVWAIRSGDLDGLRRLLEQHPGLASGRIRRRAGTHTALHVVADWPGYFPGGPEAARLLLDAGADPDARTEGGPKPETPLHWAASTDDRDVAEVLIEGGSDVEAAGGSIGTPLANAVGYGCWHVARLLVERGARVERLWQAAALGLPGRVAELLAADPAPGPDELTEAFWQACHGGQRRVADTLLRRGADPNGRPDYAGESATEIVAGPDTRRSLMATWLAEQGGQAG